MKKDMKKHTQLRHQQRRAPRWGEVEWGCANFRWTCTRIECCSGMLRYIKCCSVWTLWPKLRGQTEVGAPGAWGGLSHSQMSALKRWPLLKSLWWKDTQLWYICKLRGRMTYLNLVLMESTLLHLIRLRSWFASTNCTLFLHRGLTRCVVGVLVLLVMEFSVLAFHVMLSTTAFQ